MAVKNLTEGDVKKIAKEEFKECFEQLATDVRDIKQALLGNDYNNDGLITIVKTHEAYIESNKNTRVAERGMKVIEWYERLSKEEGTDKQSKLQVLEDGIDGLKTIGTLKKWAIFFGVTNGGTLIALIASLIKNGTGL